MAKIDKNITQFKLLMKEYNITFAENSFYDNGKKLLEFIHIFDNVADSRIPGKCIYSTKFIVLVVFLALLGNCETWQEIADFAEYRYDTLSKYIEYPETLPVHDTYMRVFSKINCKTLEDSIINFLIECTKNVVNDNVSHNGFEQIAMDGKALRGSGRKYDTDEKVANQQIMHFWDVSNQLCIRSVTISEKTNEIPVAQQVLSELDIKNKIITSDALNCQKETVNVIVEGKGHYVLALKANHSSFHEDIVKYFDEHILKIMNTSNYYKPEIEKNHNQVEVREYFRVDASSFYQEDEWKSIKSVVCYRKKLWNNHTKNESYEYRYFISDLKDVETIAIAIRNHWSVENNLHHTLDKFMHEDANKTMDKNANNNLSLVRKMVAAIIVLIAPLFKGGSKQRTIKSFNAHYDENLVRLFKFLEGKELKELLNKKNN